MGNSRWELVTLGDVTTECKERAGDDPDLQARPVYGVDRSVGLTSVAKYTASSFERYKTLEHGMFAYNPMRLNIGSIGYCSQYIEPGLVSPDYVVFECNREKLDPDFLNYYIDSPAWKEWTANAGVGSVRMRIYYKELARLPLLLPSLPEQCAIAEVLRTLDDKIEFNSRMNRTLEVMAHAMFHYWFMDGEEVQDWEEKTLEDVTVKITKGTTPTTLGQRFTDSGINFVKVNSITDDHGFITESFDFIDEETNALLSRSAIEKDDVLLTIAGTIGKVAKVPEHILPANANQAVAIIRADKSQVLPNYIRMWLCLDEVRRELFANVVQAVQANLSLGMISKTKIRLPEYSRLIELFQPVELLLNKIELNQKESRTLASLRDTLLPKLMRGEVRVNREG